MNTLQDSTLRLNSHVPAKCPAPDAPLDCGNAHTPRLIDSSALLGPSAECQIRHAGQIYRLRRTRQGRLILTK
jgi:hemin uptake protein HemP